MKIKYDLDSGKKKEYEKMTKKEKEEVSKKIIKGGLIFAGVMMGIHFLDKW